MRLTNAHRDAYVLSLMGWPHDLIADQLQEDFGQPVTADEVSCMIRQVRKVVHLQQRSAASSGQAVGV